MRSFSRYLLAGLLMLGLMTGCGGDDDGGSTGSNPQGSELSQLQLTMPTALSGNNDPGAQVAAGFITQFNALAESFRGYFTPPSGAIKESVPTLASDDIWTWTQGSQTWVLTYQESASNRQWTLKVNNETLMEAYELTDGSYGYFNIYDLSADELIFHWEWQTGPANSISYLMESDYMKLTVDVNGNGSGTINYYESNTLAFECNWTTSGGSWTDYRTNDGGNW
ncbi:hypothetical protein GF356_00560 [candidate division GN15 bacterium]|nr:hypothetical protein [candidate division GN15 bacterium]